MPAKLPELNSRFHFSVIIIQSLNKRAQSRGSGAINLQSSELQRNRWRGVFLSLILAKIWIYYTSADPSTIVRTFPLILQTWDEQTLDIQACTRWTLLGFKAHRIPSSLSVQAWPGVLGSSGRRTIRPALGWTGDQGKGFGFPNKVTWTRDKNLWFNFLHFMYEQSYLYPFCKLIITKLVVRCHVVDSE